MKSIFVLLFIVLITDVSAQEVFDLEGAINYALAHNGLIEASKYGTEALEAKMRQAEWAKWPHTELKLFSAPMAGQRGNPQKGYTDIHDLGVFFQVDFTGVLPLYTFGKLTHLKNAAKLGVEVGKAQEEIVKSEVIFRVKKGFVGLQGATEILEMIREGREYLDKAERYLRERENDPSYDPVDKLKLKVYDAQVKAKEIEARRAVEMAKFALKTVLGIPIENDVDFNVMPLETIPVPKNLKVEELEERALKTRPEIVALRKGVSAKQEEVALRKSSFYPEFFLAGQVKYSYSDVADPQDSPFAYDPYNTYTVGGGLGLKWDFEIGKKIGELKEAQSSLKKLETELKELENATRLEIRKLFMEMEDARVMVLAQKEAMEAARGWVIAKTDLYENGLCDLTDVLTGLVQFFQTRLEHAKAIQDFNNAVIALEKAVGIYRLQEIENIR